MKLLLKRDVPKLGYVGDVVEVSAGYARNYLLPHHIGVEPSSANLKAVVEMRKHAEEQRRMQREALEKEVQRLAGVEVTIAAAANEEGVLYGSVGAKEIAAALRQEGYRVDAGQVNLRQPLRRLDNVVVELHFAEDLTANVKVWVVRDKAEIPTEKRADKHAADRETAGHGSNQP